MINSKTSQSDITIAGVLILLTISNALFINSALNLLMQIVTIVTFVIYRKTLTPNKANNDYKFVRFYSIWIIICIIRGLFLIENYPDFRIFIDNTIRLLPPLLVYVFYRDSFIQTFYGKWTYVIFILTSLFLGWRVGLSQFYLTPYLLIVCLLPIWSKKQRIFLVVFIVAYIFNFYPDGRMQTIKGLFALLTGIAMFFIDKISLRRFPLLLKVSYASVIIAYTMVLFNAYGMISGSMDAVYTRTEDDKKGDTRSLLYYDVVNSAIKHNYVLWGRTPARGNDVEASQALFLYVYDYDESSIYRGQRGNNEVGVLNYFTHSGLLGLILYCAIFFKGTYLAVYKSRNRYIKLLACYTAFQWVCSWIENSNNIDILNVGIWCLVGMCYSPSIRQMNDNEFKFWAQGLVRWPRILK